MNEYETQNKTHTHEMNQLVKKHDNDIKKVLTYIKIQGERNIDRDTNINDIQSKVQKNVQDIVGFNFNDLKTKVDKNASDIELMNIDHWKSNVNKNTNDIQNILKLESTFTNNYESNLNKINVINQKMKDVLFLVLVNNTTKTLKPGVHHIINDNLHLRNNNDGNNIYEVNFLNFFTCRLKKGYGIRFIYDKNTKSLLKNDIIFLELNILNLAAFSNCINIYDKFEIFNIDEKMKNITLLFIGGYEIYSIFFFENFIFDKKTLMSFLDRASNHDRYKNIDPFKICYYIINMRYDMRYDIHYDMRLRYDIFGIISYIRPIINTTFFVYLISGDEITYAFRFNREDQNLLDKFNNIKDKNFELIKITNHEL